MKLATRTPVASRTTGHCSTCSRGHGRGAKPVVLIKLAAQGTAHRTIPPWSWLGVCLKCARLIAEALDP